MGKPPEKGSIEFLACQLPRLSRTIRPVDLVRAIVPRLSRVGRAPQELASALEPSVVIGGGGGRAGPWLEEPLLLSSPLL